MRENSRNEYNSFSLLRFVFSKWKIFLIVLVASAVLSFVCASLIKPHYRATAVIFGPRTNAISKVLLADETNNERLDIKAYAIEEETEQMLRLLYFPAHDMPYYAVFLQEPVSCYGSA